MAIVNDSYVEDVCNLISVHLGVISANMYRDFYADKDIATIKISAMELLGELLGENRSRIEMMPILKKHKLSGGE